MNTRTSSIYITIFALIALTFGDPNPNPHPPHHNHHHHHHHGSGSGGGSGIGSTGGGSGNTGTGSIPILDGGAGRAPTGSTGTVSGSTGNAGVVSGSTGNAGTGVVDNGSGWNRAPPSAPYHGTCECNYMNGRGGCFIFRAPSQPGFKCSCRVATWAFFWNSCIGTRIPCSTGEHCPGSCATKECCLLGGGDCRGYP